MTGGFLPGLSLRLLREIFVARTERTVKRRFPAKTQSRKVLWRDTLTHQPAHFP